MSYQTAHTYNYRLLKDYANKMRKQPTEAESILWQYIRAKQLGKKFNRQHIIEDYIVDFVCIEKMLIIEVDGKYHADGEQREFDAQRELTLKQLGYKIIRFTNEEVMVNIDNVIQQIKYNLN